MQYFAVPVPRYGMADQLGVPLSHRDRFKEWSDSAVAPLGLLLSDERKIECAKSAVEMQHYFVEVFADRRANPRDDMISYLVTKEIDGAPLSIPDLLSILNQLLATGTRSEGRRVGKEFAIMCRYLC